jgi:hypothetical protein
VDPSRANVNYILILESTTGFNLLYPRLTPETGNRFGQRAQAARFRPRRWWLRWLRCGGVRARRPARGQHVGGELSPQCELIALAHCYGCTVECADCAVQTGGRRGGRKDDYDGEWAQGAPAGGAQEDMGGLYDMVFQNHGGADHAAGGR